MENHCSVAMIIGPISLSTQSRALTWVILKTHWGNKQLEYTGDYHPDVHDALSDVLDEIHHCDN